jgi:hypothetical protein
LLPALALRDGLARGFQLLANELAEGIGDLLLTGIAAVQVDERGAGEQ